MDVLTITGESINRGLRDRCLALDAEVRELQHQNAQLQRTVDAVYATLGDNERLQVELQVARLSSTVLQAELRAAFDRIGGTEDYMTVLRKLVKEEQALTSRLTRRAS